MSMNTRIVPGMICFTRRINGDSEFLATPGAIEALPEVATMSKRNQLRFVPVTTVCMSAWQMFSIGFLTPERTWARYSYATAAWCRPAPLPRSLPGKVRRRNR